MTDPLDHSADFESIDPWQDNAEAHDIINRVLQGIVERLDAIEKYVQEMPTVDKTYYKPKGYDDYLNVKQNYDIIYERLTKLEKDADE
tara:strand:- start:10185 stop:10448 length:264 start_codon:yes stop_codon:yes gene_type:complete